MNGSNVTVHDALCLWIWAGVRPGKGRLPRVALSRVRPLISLFIVHPSSTPRSTCSSPQRMSLLVLLILHFHISFTDLQAPVSPPSRSGTNSRTKRATRTATIATGSPKWHSPDSVSSPLPTATWRPSESSVFLASPIAFTHLSPQLPQSFPVSTLIQLPYHPTPNPDTVRNSRPSPETGQNLPQTPSSACEFLLNLPLSMPPFVLPCPLRSSPLKSHLAISLRAVYLCALSMSLLTQSLISSLDRVVQRM